MVMGSVKRLLVPLVYLRIRRPDKFLDEIVLPAAFLALSLVIFWVIDWKIQVFGDKGLISGVGSYLQIVTGFYIASLAAVATFNQKDMDKRMDGDSPILTPGWLINNAPETLTRRRFLCFLFGYLSFCSIFLYFCGIAANLVAYPIAQMIPAQYAFTIKWSFACVYLFVLYNLISTTLLGLYYMTERIHRPSAEFTDSPIDAETDKGPQRSTGEPTNGDTGWD